jgi:arsenate reductase
MSASDFPVTIFHNPNCGTSRNTLGLIRAAGYEPEVVEYVKRGWTADQLKALFARMGVAARDVMRVRGTPAEDLGLTKDGVSDDAIIAAMTEHPLMVERPIVSTPKGAVLARPFDLALTVLDKKPARFTKESGEVVEF